MQIARLCLLLTNLATRVFFFYYLSVTYHLRTHTFIVNNKKNLGDYFRTRIVKRFSAQYVNFSVIQYVKHYCHTRRLFESVSVIIIF